MSHRPLIVALAAAVLFSVTPSARGATLYVASNGVNSTVCGSFVIDGSNCGAKDFPCRSISCAIREAAAGDTIIVGPGRYGDLNSNGTPGDSIGEEIPAPGCGCMLAMNKAVSLISSHGAAATVIDGRSVGGANSVATVVIFAVAGEFGRPGKGFTVTNTADSNGGTAIVVDANNVAIRGNQVVSFAGLTFNTPTGTGIGTVDFPQTISIEGNQLMGWGTAIRAAGDGKTVRKNEISLCSSGISISGNSRATGNVIVGTAFSVEPKQTAAVVGNAFYGNRITVNAQPGFTGVIQKNNFVGSSDDCALTNLSGTNDLDVTNNYWGVPTGPGPDPADDYCDFLGTATVVPFATKPFGVKARVKP